WHRSGRNIIDYFKFEPYLYGPCSFEVYSALDETELNRQIVQPLHSVPQWVNYYLTESGKKEAEEVSERTSPETVSFIRTVVKEISQLGFYELLKKVYTEAPDFAVNSMFKGVIK
ncbi:MAG: hypothetical protein HY769_05910, partial [Candidatus Stahlbacteria bacterium]|nr:hypothetical protein [Candidatus Stahlbacteria bacterium]